MYVLLICDSSLKLLMQLLISVVDVYKLTIYLLQQQFVVSNI